MDTMNSDTYTTNTNLNSQPRFVSNDSLTIRDKPKRCLTSYNLFFQAEREKLLNEKGRLGFAGLARTIAAKWKEVDTDTKAHFEELAARDKVRYTREVKIWRQQQRDEELAAASLQIPQNTRNTMSNYTFNALPEGNASAYNNHYYKPAEASASSRYSNMRALQKSLENQAGSDNLYQFMFQEHNQGAMKNDQYQPNYWHESEPMQAYSSSKPALQQQDPNDHLARLISNVLDNKDDSFFDAPFDNTTLIEPDPLPESHYENYHDLLHNEHILEF